MFAATMLGLALFIDLTVIFVFLHNYSRCVPFKLLFIVNITVNIAAAALFPAVEDAFYELSRGGRGVFLSPIILLAILLPNIILYKNSRSSRSEYDIAVRIGKTLALWLCNMPVFILSYVFLTSIFVLS